GQEFERGRVRCCFCLNIHSFACRRRWPVVKVDRGDKIDRIVHWSFIPSLSIAVFMSAFSKIAGLFAFLLLACAGMSYPVVAAGKTPPSVEQDNAWIYRGTDIPRDPEWVFGTLKNGVRYAVRRNT